MCALAAPVMQPRMVDEKQTMVYKRAVDKNYSLKLKASRSIFSEINSKFPIMPFTARCSLCALLSVCFTVHPFSLVHPCRHPSQLCSPVLTPPLFVLALGFPQCCAVFCFVKWCCCCSFFFLSSGRWRPREPGWAWWSVWLMSSCNLTLFCMRSQVGETLRGHCWL